MTPPESNLEEAMHKLFTAKWNIPQAVASMGLKATQEEWEKMQRLFYQFCLDNPPTYSTSDYKD